MRWSAAQTIGWILRRQPLHLEQWTTEMGPELSGAQKQLAMAIASGQVQAWGRKQAHALTEQLPTDPFRISGLPTIVNAHGEMVSRIPHRPYEGPKWQSVEFASEEIKRAWPKPPPSSAKNWMQQEANRLSAAGQIGKRDDMVTLCMEATSCTKRQAQAAHREMPETLRRRRGKPSKSSG